MIKVLCKNITKTVISRLQEKGLTAEEANDVLSEVRGISNPFKNLKTIDDQLNHFEKHFGLVKPVEKFLDTRIDRRLDPSTNCQVPTQVKETFQYVSIIKSLSALLKIKKFRDQIFKNKASSDGVLRSYIDGTNCKGNPFVVKYEAVIELLMFFDELEVANALGSKTIIHKLAAFFCQVLNLPPEVSSRLSSILLLALANADDMKKPGAMEKVLTPLIHELKTLSSENGVRVDIGEEVFVLRAVLSGVTADTLAAHDLLGLLSPSANRFCRRCLVSRQEIRADANAVGQLRTKEEHQRQVEMVLQQPSLSKEYGIKKACPLDEVPFFDWTTSTVFDVFHDLLEGVVPLDLKLVIRQFVFVDKFFSVRDLNLRIASFAYGVPDSKNKPSANMSTDILLKSSRKIKQTGSQMWCLARSLPFLIGDWVPEGNPYMKLIFLLQNIMEIVFSFEVTVDDLQFMDGLITDHNQMFQHLFVDVQQQVEVEVENDQDVSEDDAPAAVGEQDAGRRRNKKKLSRVHVTNKLHHLKHLLEMALSHGPPVRLWCAKFEARMKIFRQHAAVCCNFKNPTMTMAKMFQLSSLSAQLGNAEEFLTFHRGNQLRVENTHHKALLNGAGLHDAVEIVFTNSATLNGEEYRPGLFACLPGDHASRPEFALITDVIVNSNDLLLVLRPWENAGLSPKYNCFQVKPIDGQALLLLNAKSLRHFRCIAPWTSLDTDDIYMSLRTVLV
ncbi:hypothetical protein ONE63_000041 [Megalurothrips usitatus]|uniref:Uncharacterized protein n=1 Tax=Megalurothrips usitatus TaxID=439358 RepID=A0AAV7XY96_9NEOP|nr:hypothetical protein ONE63_000041 [Megalurothrips usitatus]